VTKITVKPGGKNVPNMHDTLILVDNHYAHGKKLQKVQFDNNLHAGHPYKQFEGKLKGIKAILYEWGLIPQTTFFPNDG